MGILFISYELVFAMFFSPMHARAFPQEFHLLPQFLGDFNELNFYKKESVSCIIIYEATFKLGFIPTGI